jgi:hypothetical protein
MTTQITHHSIHPKNGKIVPGLFNSMQEAFREVKRLGFGLTDVVIQDVKIKKEKVKKEKIKSNMYSVPDEIKDSVFTNPTPTQIEKFRDGIFLAASRTYGEKFIEPIIREYLRLTKPTTNDYDATDNYGIRFEIKSTKVLTGQKRKKNLTLLEKILSENDNYVINRLVPFQDYLDSNYYSNVQNVKRDHFDQLIYIMLFEDCIKIFISEKKNISDIPNWCDKHGRYDALGKSGQFGITKRNIGWHIQHNLKATLNWSEFYEITKNVNK